MFSNTFFPTPEWLASKMAEPLRLQDAYLLEPSAGKGDILDAILGSRCGHRGDVHAYAIEIVPELRAILVDKGYNVVANDFLTYQPRVHFNLIVMNPPFDHAEDHLLHAWEILYDGEIACLLPSHCLEGKNSKEQTILALIDDYGSREKVGQAFKDAERKTDVQVEIVRLKKCANGQKLEWEIHNHQEEPTFNDDGKTQEVALNGFVNGLLSSYSAAVNNFQVYNEARQKLTVYCAPFGRTKTALEVSDEQKTPGARWNTFVTELDAQAWDKLMDHPGFQAVLTERARKMMAEFRARQRKVDFNEANIRAMLDEVIAKKDEILSGAVLDAFDTMTKYHEENRIYYEGWKSNKAWKVNLKKVVLPGYIRVSWSGQPDLSYYRDTEALTDIDRAMCVVSGIPFTEIQTMYAALQMHFRLHSWGSEVESTFFAMRYYKKGTLHLRFLDEELGKKFNFMAAKARNWLPPGKSKPEPQPEPQPQPANFYPHPDDEPDDEPSMALQPVAQAAFL